MTKPKLTRIPLTPGVYFHKNKAGRIIYVGKAARLRNRVGQYFQAAHLKHADTKTKALVAEIAATDWIEVDSELEALFLESEMIKRYRPHYNILERDDKAWQYVRIDRSSPLPTVTTTRLPLDDGADYCGPYINSPGLRRALKYLRRVFPYSTHKTLPKQACLHYHLGLCPGPETDSFDLLSYRQDLTNLTAYLRGRRKQLVKSLEQAMKLAASAQDYELAARRRNQLRALAYLTQETVFGDKENLDLNKDHALNDLSELLNLSQPPRRIEGFDISHTSGQHTVASMVVFINGASARSDYRKFKMRLAGNDDFAHMAEVIRRRFTTKNLRVWGEPDLVLIDGGRGQLAAASSALSQSQPIMIGLAKKQEQIVISSSLKLNQAKLAALAGYQSLGRNFTLINLPKTSYIIQLLQRIRDESHRFAISYHTLIRAKAQTSSQLTDIPTIGPVTRRKLLSAFGSLKTIRQASPQQLAEVVGTKKAKLIKRWL